MFFSTLRVKCERGMALKSLSVTDRVEREVRSPEAEKQLSLHLSKKPKEKRGSDLCQEHKDHLGRKQEDGACVVQRPSVWQSPLISPHSHPKPR